MMTFKPTDELEDGELVVGVCYAPAAEDIIKMNGLDLTVMGYLVTDNDISGMSPWGLPMV